MNSTISLHGGVLCERGEYFLSLMVIREKDKEIRIKDETLTRKSTAQDDTCGVRWDPHGFEKRILRMTEKLDKIATSSNQRTAGFLAMTEQ